jgi:hypothetical protein
VGSQPYLIQGDSDTVGVVDSAVSARWFKGGSGPAISAMFGGLDSLAVINAPSSDGGSTDPSGYNQE